MSPRSEGAEGAGSAERADSADRADNDAHADGGDNRATGSADRADDAHRARRARRTIATLSLTETVSWGVLFYSFGALLVPMQQDLGASRAEVSIALTLAISTRALAAPLVGAIIDRVGARALMTTGSAAAVLATLAWAQARDLVGLYLVFAVIGVVSATVFYEPAFALAARWYDGHALSRAILALTVVAGFASTIALPTTAALTTWLGWRTAVQVLAAALLVLTLLPHLLWLREPPRQVGRTGDGDQRAPEVSQPESASPPSASPPSASAPSAPPPAAPVPRTPPGATTAQALRDPGLWWLSLALIAGTMPLIAVGAHLPALLGDRGVSPTLAASATGLLGALSVTGRILLTAAQLRVSVGQLFGLVFVAQAVGLVILALGSGPAVVAVFLVTFGLGFGAHSIFKPQLLLQRYGRHRYATIAGIVAALMTGGQALAPLLAGLSYDRTGSYRTALLSLAASALCAAGCLWQGLRQPRR